MARCQKQLLLEPTNEPSKKSRKYSHTNPPYLEEAAALSFESGIKHLLIDLPSVDKEKDEGKL
jgi:hypothetical protein